MRVLLIHSDYLKYQTKSKTKIAEEIDDTKKQGEFNESLVAFTAVEKEDEADIEMAIKNAVKEIVNVYSQVKAENVVLYPYAHLSSSLSAPDAAKTILKGIEEAVRAEGIDVFRVPFGWYKAFEVSCKGHPLSELSRTIGTEKSEEDAEEEKVESKWFIFDDDELIETDKFQYNTRKQLKQLVEYELGEGESTGEEPPHVKLMREKGLADYESSADVGHLRWYPKGRLVRDLLADYVYNLVTDEGAMVVETPIMYDLADKAINEHAAKFGERQYRLGHKGKDLMLRFACCFGAFRMLADSFLTWKNLPAKIYELSTYSFRLEKKGEVVGLKRLRGFTMPDMHSVCTDIPQSLEEFERQVDMCMKTGVDFGVNYEVIFRATEDFYEENKEWMHETAKKIGKPLLLELLPERKHYWVSKMDFAAIDYLGRPIENPTVQIDVESGKRFGIEYLCEDENEEHPIILHCSPTGSIERVICSLLEKTAIELNEKQPMLPSWMSPTQVRILPITENHLDFALELSDKIKEANIRVDVDDRQERIGKKIRNAGKDWIPFVVVIGDNEVNGDTITVNVRSTKEKIEMSVEDLIAMVKAEAEGMPYRPLPLPRELSKRINF